MRRSTATVGSAVFFVLAPCVVAGLVPWLISGWESTSADVAARDRPDDSRCGVAGTGGCRAGPSFRPFRRRGRRYPSAGCPYRAARGGW